MPNVNVNTPNERESLLRGLKLLSSLPNFLSPRTAHDSPWVPLSCACKPEGGGEALAWREGSLAVDRVPGAADLPLSLPLSKFVEHIGKLGVFGRAAGVSDLPKGLRLRRRRLRVEAA